MDAIATWQATVTAVTGGVTAASVIGVAYQVYNGVQQNKRKTEEETRTRILATGELLSRWDSPPMQQARQLAAQFSAHALREYVERLSGDPNRLDDYNRLLAIPEFLDNLAALVFRGALDLTFVTEQMGDVIVHEWDRWRDTIYWLRMRSEFDPYVNLRRLAELLLAGDPGAINS